MKSFFQLSKALSVGTLAALLLVASTSNQIALGAASPTTATAPTVAMSSQSQMWWAAVTGEFVRGIIDGFNAVPQASDQHTLVAMEHYQSADFSQFD